MSNRGPRWHSGTTAEVPEALRRTPDATARKRPPNPPSTGAGQIVAGHVPEPPEVPDYGAFVLPPGEHRRVAGVHRFRPEDPDSEDWRRVNPGGRRASLGGWVLIPSSSDAFVSPLDYATVRIVRDGDEAVGRTRALDRNLYRPGAALRY